MSQRKLRLNQGPVGLFSASRLPGPEPHAMRRADHTRGFGRTALRRGGRVVECTALEMRHRCKPIGSSNLPLSANFSDSRFWLVGDPFLHTY